MAKAKDKLAIFVREYLVDQNGTRAAIAAGYAEKSASVTASRLLKNAKVRAEIDKATQERCKRLDITADRVLQEIAKLAFYDPREFFTGNGQLKQVRELDDNTAMALAGMEINELWEPGEDGKKEQVGYTKKFKLADKGVNLERLGKHLKLFTDKFEAQGPDGMPLTTKILLIGAKEANV